MPAPCSPRPKGRLPAPAPATPSGAVVPAAHRILTSAREPVGIVGGGRPARYQAVGPDPDHRRRGLAGRLLGRAAAWAAEQGCTEWVIVTEAVNPAGRLYRSVGFVPTTETASVYLAPPG